MNKWCGIGRLTKDAELKTTSSGINYCNFIIAVDRRFKDANGNRQADFIACVAWRTTADFISKYFKKGNKIAVVGSIQTRTYEDQNGQKKLVTEVIVDEAEFVESKNSGSASPAAQNQTQESVVPTAPAENAPAASEEVEMPFEL